MALQTARMTHTTRSTRAVMAPPPRRPGRPRKTVEPTPEPSGIEDGADTVVPLKARTVRLIDAVRVPFKTHVTMFGHMDEKAADLAPGFMRAFDSWKAETDGSFVTFVRLFDDTIPANRDPDPKDRTNQGYRNHRAYRAADYLRRLAGPRDTEERDTGEEREGPLPVSMAFIRLLAAIVALIPGNQVEKLWEIIGSELHWTEGRVTTLRTQVEEVEPLVEAKADRGHLAVEPVH